MMAVDLARAWSNLELAERTGRWWRTKGLSPRMSASDRRLVIGSLTDEGFYNVDRAESAVDYWYGIRDHAITESPRLADSYKQEDLTRVLGWIEAAQATLREITGDPIELAREPRAARQTVD